MRQFWSLPGQAVFFGLLAYVGCAAIVPAADDPAPPSAALSMTLLQRAQAEVDRIKPLVENGTLPRTSLTEAEAKLADAEEDETLMETLFGPARVQDMTEAQAEAMLGAAQRRVDRQAKLVDERRNLLTQGILARSDEESFENELRARQHVLLLAQDRARLLNDLKEMAATEERFIEASRTAALKGLMLRYDGNGLFNPSELTAISAQFEQRFHHQLPISASGETALHRSMGLDHRGRVDVALNPDSIEGAWLRGLLEKLRIPYLAFRTALSGAATGPHIHIGTGSTRLALALR
ncbi:MAG: hypothetical protein JO033_28645 [Acidobacteriaceae bacterium]|nr:hypothetical protein [Acidobacteriaceae bacterium]MBV9501120.1 hypothetical protein [Acidobacteriaceae bacterium]